MKEMYKGMVNSPVTELKESISAQSTVIKVNDINAFPDGPNLAAIGTDENAETIYYATKTTNALSGCQRGVEGSAKTWNAGEKIARNFTNKDHADLIDNINEVKQRADQAFQSASNGKKAIAAAVTGKGVAASESDTFQVLAGKIEQITQGSGNAMPRDVLLGKTFSNSDGSAVGAMPNNGNWTQSMTLNGRVAIPEGYHSGQGAVTISAVGARTIMPRAYEQMAVGAGRMARGDVKVAGDSNLKAENIKEGVSIFGVQGALKSNNVKCSLIPPLDFVESKIALPDTDYPDRKIHPRLQFQEANGIQLMVFLAYTYTLESDEKVFPIRYGTNGALNKKSTITARPIYNFSNPAATWFAILTIDERVNNFCIEFDTEYYDLEGYAYIVRW